MDVYIQLLYNRLSKFYKGYLLNKSKMPPEINRQSSVPIYQQIMNWMREKIQSGDWAKDHQLISEIDLAELLQVSRGTVRKAIEGLISERLLVRVHGKGTFVRKNILLEQNPDWRLAGFSRDLISRDIPYSTQVLKKEIIPPAIDIRELLNISVHDKIFHMLRLRIIDNQPVLIIENHIVYAYCEGVETVDFSIRQLYTTLEEDFNMPFDWGRRTFKSKLADPTIAKHLEIPQNSPVMYLEELYHNHENTPLEYTRAWFNAQVFHIRAIVKREQEKVERTELFQ